MAELLAELPPHVAALWIAGSILYVLLIHSPLIFSSVVALRRGTHMKRRILFIGAVMMLTYGFLFLVLSAVCVPIGAFMIFFVPALVQMGHMKSGSLLVAVADFVAGYWWLLLPVGLVAAAFLVTRYLSRRWNHIAEALDG